MTQREITDKMVRLHFVGKWSLRRLAKESGLSFSTMREAVHGRMSAITQTRLEMMFRQLPEKCSKPAPKRKPGHRKRYMIRYLNLRKWIAAIEEREGKNPNFNIRNRYEMRTEEEAGYVCTKLDYMMKSYLLRVFGAELKKKKIFMGDCFAAEKWIDRIAAVLPTFKKELISKLQERK